MIWLSSVVVAEAWVGVCGRSGCSPPRRSDRRDRPIEKQLCKVVGGEVSKQSLGAGIYFGVPAPFLVLEKGRLQLGPGEGCRLNGRSL